MGKQERAKKNRNRKAPRRNRPGKGLPKWGLLGAGGLLALLVAGWIGWGFLNDGGGTTVAGSNPYSYVDAPPAYGSATAPVDITVYEDFHCTACGHFETQVVPQLEDRFIKTGEARFVFRHFVHYGPDSRRAAQAVECVHEQDRANGTELFPEFKTTLFRNQGGYHDQSFTLEKLTGYAREAGVENVEAFRVCVDSGRYADKIEQSTQEIRARGASGTPTVTVGERMFVGIPSIRTFEQAISAQAR